MKLPLALAAGLAAMTSTPAAEVPAGDAKLAARFKAWLDAECDRHPVFATRQGDHRHDDRMDDLTPAARAADLTRTRKLLADLPAEFAGDNLSRAARIDLAIWVNALKADVWRAENLDEFATDPRVYGEYFSDSVFLLFTQSTLPRPRNVANAAKRIAEVPEVLAAAKQSLKTPPAILTEVAIQRTAGAIAFYEADIFALAGEAAATSELAGPCKAAATALKDYLAYLKADVLPRSTGEWRLGKARFAEKLAVDLDAGLTADEVLAEAEAEATRVEREMAVVSRQLWSKCFPGVPVPPDDAAGRRDMTQRVLTELGKDRGTPETLLADTQKTVAAVKDFIRANRILTLPDPDRCKIIEMPEFQRGFAAAYLNPAPPLDPSAASIYAISPPPRDWPAARRDAFFGEYNKAMLQILTIHEAYPGHYVQLEYANRHPSLVRKVLSSGTYAEGWAVYTEQTMLDQGYAAGDLSVRLHQLKFYLRAVLNAILDHKMHCSAMTDEAAQTMLTGRGFQTEAEAVGKVRRSKQSAAQLSTYFVGRTAFYRLRQQVQRNRGESFDLGKYHEDVLNQGTIPVKYLAELVK